MTSRTETIHDAIAVLQRLSDLFGERREQIAREAGLSVSQWRVLEEISTEHFMPTMFAQRRAITAAAVSKLVRGMLERKLAAWNTVPALAQNFIISARPAPTSITSPG